MEVVFTLFEFVHDSSYYNELKNSRWFDKARLLDIRGNHDHTNSVDSPKQFYHNYTICGQEEPVYIRKFAYAENSTICFIGYDGTGNPCIDCYVDSIH